MRRDTLALYHRNRAQHIHAHGTYRMPAAQALRAAKYDSETLRRWNAAERAGLVRIETRSDDDPSAWENYFDGDMYTPECHPDYPGGARALAAEKKRAEAHIEAWGLAFVVGEFRTDPNSDRWKSADSIGGIEGDADPRDAHGYGPDIMRATLAALRESLKIEQRKRADLRAQRCPHCHGTGRA